MRRSRNADAEPDALHMKRLNDVGDEKKKKLTAERTYEMRMVGAAER